MTDSRLFIPSRFFSLLNGDDLFADVCTIQKFVTGSYSGEGEFTPTWITHQADVLCRVAPATSGGNDETRNEQETINRSNKRIALRLSDATITPNMRCVVTEGATYNILNAEVDGNGLLTYLDCEVITQ